MRLFKTAAAIALGVALTTTGALAATPKDTLVVADAIDDVITLDPGEVSEVAGVFVSQQIYQPLVTFDIKDPTKIVGVLAESWTVSDDGKTFTFKMNPNAKFASGNKVTAYDAEFSLQRPVLLNTRISFILTQFGFTPDNVKDMIKAIDDETLQFTVDQQYAPSFVLYVLSSYTGGIVDSKIVKEHEVDGDLGNAWLKTANSAGSGPYVLSKWDPKKSILLSRNENFWQTPPGVNRVFIQQMPESATQRLALEKGDIDVANKLGPDDFAAIEGNADISILQGNDTTIYYFALNMRNENLKDPRVVKAIKYLVRLSGHRRHDRSWQRQGPPDHDPRRLPRRRHRLRALLVRSRKGQGASRRRPASAFRSPSTRSCGTCRPIPTTPRRSSRRLPRPASISTSRSLTASNGSTATARTIWISGSGCGDRTIPIRTRTPRPSRSTIRAIRKARRTLLTALPMTRASCPTRSSPR